MGLTICEKHGRSGIALVCKHIHLDVVDGRKIDHLFQLKNRFDEDYSWECNLCRECQIHYGVASEETSIFCEDDVFDRVATEMVSVCGCCFAEISPENSVH